jgi:DNA repair exonuclease SbcCD ATPase subunit
MDQFEALREKIANLRAEIAELKHLNEQYRRERLPDAQDHFAHGKRLERLVEIQQELTRLANLGGSLRSLEQMKEQHRSGPYLKKAS